MKHTEDPWELLPGGFDETLGYYEPSVQSPINEHTGLRQQIATIRVGLKETEANGFLIAAAPDLFRACRQMMVAIHSIKHVLEFVAPATAAEFVDGWNAIEAAIAKAESAGLEAQ